MTGNKGKRPQTHSMQTRSSAASATIDNNDSTTSTHPTNDFATEDHSNVSQAMTVPDLGSSSRPTFKARRDTQSESAVSGATFSASRASPPSSITGSSTSTISSGNTACSGNIANKDVVSWIHENYEVRSNSNVPRSGIYEHYKYYCTLQQAKSVNAATFGKLIRVAFPDMSTRRLGNRGQSKYQYCNIQRRELPENPPATGGATPDVPQASTSSSVPNHGSSQQHQNPHYLAPDTHPEASTARNITGNAETVHPTTLLSYQVTESASLSSQQQRLTSGFNNNNSTNPMIDTRTPHDLHGYPPLQLPSPFGLISSSLSSSNSPPLLPQHYLSNIELVSIFSPQPTTSHQQDMSTSTLSRPLVSSSSSSLSSSMTLLAGSETLDSISIPRRFSDPQGASSPTDQFASLYNQHCQDIYNAVCAGEFEKLQPIYYQFYQQMPNYYRSMVITTPELTDSIWHWDCNLYDSFIIDLLPKVNSPISKNMANGLNDYTRNLPRYLQYLLVGYPTKLRNKKFDVACVFVAKMRRHLTLNQFAMKAETILSQPMHLVEMRRDWESLDIGTILDHALWICDCRNDDMAKILKGDITQLLNSKSSLLQWMDWVDGLVEKFVPRFPRIQDNQADETFMKDAKQFVLKWRMYTSSVMQQLYMKNVPTLESFKALQFFFDDLILYRVEERIASVYANTIQRPSPASASVV